MKTINSIIQQFRKSFNGEQYSDRNRLCEAFELLDKNIQSISSADGANKFYTKAYSSVNLTIPTATPTALAFNSETSEVGGMHSTTTLNTRFTIQRAGNYLIFANVKWPIFAVANIALMLEIQFRGGNIIGSTSIESSGAGLVPYHQQVIAGDYFNVGDYLEVIATQASGGNLVIPATAAFSPYCYIVEN